MMFRSYSNISNNGDHFRTCGNHNDGDLFTCEDMKFSQESSLGISLVFM